MRWQLASAAADTVGELARELGISPLTCRLLAVRGITEPAAAEQFLHPRLAHLHDPFLMAGMEAAVARLRRAIAAQEKILIYGDYDVDGTTAVVVLLAALGSLGACVDVHIPHRLRDGYGMRLPVVERAAAEGYTVLVSVDTGIREHEVVARARELGIDCIITDHHLPKTSLPDACAILNPRRPDCSYPDKNLSGVGVAFKLAQALLGAGMSEAVLRSYLKVVAIGTIADVVPLTGENRVIARFGLTGLRQPVQAGLSALLEVAGLNGRTPSAGDIAFRIAPRLNAAGRMEDARAVIELLRTSDPARAREIALGLEELNSERQRVEESILNEIEETLQSHPELSERYALVFAGEGWHRGVLGIVAQRVVERRYRPTLVIGVADGAGQGSGRSISNFHLLNALTAVQDVFERFGGHAAAAGFTLPSNLLGELDARFEAYARSVLSPEDLEPLLRVDAEVDLEQVDWPLYEELRKLEPFGMGNPTPVFVARNLHLALSPQIVGKKHLKLKVGKGSKLFNALGWNQGGRAGLPEPGEFLDLAFTLDENFYQGIASLQLIIKDLRPNPDGSGLKMAQKTSPAGV
ncbi:MAG TPA: single-stranded-DNA-specific exonuclease RecJ [Terriglobia bacterium]|nr:single-stranded-DNA-specific exonuclease RecJ [Terriglobia bacterium]